jgi:hypothetical protein
MTLEILKTKNMFKIILLFVIFKIVFGLDKQLHLENVGCAAHIRFKRNISKYKLSFKVNEKVLFALFTVMQISKNNCEYNAPY